MSPRAVNINASNQCLQLVFKVRLGQLTLPVPWLAGWLEQALSRWGNMSTEQRRAQARAQARVGPHWPCEHSVTGQNPAQPGAGCISTLEAPLISLLWWRWLGKVLEHLRCSMLGWTR